MHDLETVQKGGERIGPHACVQLGSPTGPRVFCRSFIIDIALPTKQRAALPRQPGVRVILQAVGGCPCSRLKARLNASSAS